MKKELLPCPFCLSEQVELIDNYNSACQVHFLYVKCGVCGGRGGTVACKDWEKDKTDLISSKAGRIAIEKWNGRK